jgi:putative oxidoreductase
MFRRIFATSDEKHLAVLRIVLGLVMFAHGAQKLLGWFGGQGFSGTIDGFSQHLGVPAPLAVLVVIAEFFGGIGLMLGLLSRIAAFGIFCVIVVSALMVHLPNGFFMNWTGQKRGEGLEFHLLATATSIAIMLAGAGAYSIDRLLTRRRPSAVTGPAVPFGHDEAVPAHS